MLPAGPAGHGRGRLDLAGAGLVTASVMLAVYAIVNASQLPAGAAAAVQAAQPHHRQHRWRALGGGGDVRLLLPHRAVPATGAALHPLQAGLAFLPANLIMGALSLGLSARLVTRLGIKPPLTAGLLLAAICLVLLARAPADGTFLPDVLPGTIMLGLGAGTAFNPVLLAATGDVPHDQSGLASGVVNTAFVLGDALGLAVLAGAACTAAAALITARFLRPAATTPPSSLPAESARDGHAPSWTAVPSSGSR